MLTPRRSVTLANVPGGNKPWTEVLPPPFDHDPEIIAVLVPNSSVWQVLQFVDGRITASVVKLPNTDITMALQLLNPPLPTRTEHLKVFAGMNFEMVTPVYQGPLSEVPNDVLLHEAMHPLVFLRAAFNEPFLNLRQYVWSVTEGHGSPS